MFLINLSPAYFGQIEITTKWRMRVIYLTWGERDRETEWVVLKRNFNMHHFFVEQLEDLEEQVGFAQEELWG